MHRRRTSFASWTPHFHSKDVVLPLMVEAVVLNPLLGALLDLYHETAALERPCRCCNTRCQVLRCWAKMSVGSNLKMFVKFKSGSTPRTNFRRHSLCARQLSILLLLQSALSVALITDQKQYSNDESTSND